jgi:hypothetical protein
MTKPTATGRVHLAFNIEGDAVAVGEIAEQVRNERNRLAKQFAFCADNPDAPIQRTIRNLDALAKALLAEQPNHAPVPFVEV